VAARNFDFLWYSGDKPFEIIVCFFAILVTLIDFGEEIAADAMDIEGDRKVGSRSLAPVLGRENVLKISGATLYSPDIPGRISGIRNFYNH